MTFDQVALFALVTALFDFLIWGKFRYDVIAFGALILAAVLGIVPEDQVFSGFGHPAVIIVALVLIVSRGLSRSGAIDLLARRVLDASRGLQAHIGIMASLSAALSTAMNNVAALALLMPLDVQAARKAKRSPSLTLMPISFASILGGMVTLIGTPPNIVIATFRESALGEPYGMFDFAPVGAVVAVVGVIYVALVGWRLVPKDRSRYDAVRELEELQGYVAEVGVNESSPFLGKKLGDLEELGEGNEVHILGLVRRGRRLPGMPLDEELRKSDFIVLEGAPDAINDFAGAADLELSASRKKKRLASEALDMVEAVVPAGARVVGRSAMDVRLLARQGVTLLGISRSGVRIRDRVRRSPIQPGDILLMLGPKGQMPDVVHWLGCLSLAERGLEVTQRQKAWVAVGAFVAAIVVASLGWVYLPVALAAVVAIYVLLRIVPLNELYESVEWPVIVLLGSMIPLSVAMETGGGTALIANQLVVWTEGMSTVAVLALLMVITMTLSDILNNVATALIAAPIGVDIALRLDANPDAFLMAVAVAASCAFLTPIGHKNNTIILGPGGYKFGDYWRMGLPLEILVLLVGIPMILLVWPL
jgi:di/tricarboxylate transporter